ncbi:MAG: aminotransferase class IV [Candidatus Melainabacteria bacterium]
MLSRAGNLPAALLLGEGVYTSFRWPLPPATLEAHLARLTHDAAAIGIELTTNAEALATDLHAALADETLPIGIRLTVVPDVTDAGVLLAPTQQPLPGLLLLSTRPASALSATPDPFSGPRLMSVLADRPHAGIKHLGLGPTLHYRRQAHAAGFEDILWINSPPLPLRERGPGGEGFISEAGTANIFFLKNNTLYTPDPERDGCLPGITRAQLIDHAQLLGIAVRTEPVSLAEALAADGALLTNAIRGVHPVRGLDDVLYPWPTAAVETLHALATLNNTL